MNTNDERLYLQEDDIIQLKMGWSESMLHMKVADKVMGVQVLKTGAQLLDDKGKPFSFPVPSNEAGIYTDADGKQYVNKSDVVEIRRQRRTQDEILARFQKAIKDGGKGLGAALAAEFRTEVLASAMTLDTLKKIDPNYEGDAEKYPTIRDFKAYGQEYLEFAITKALDHRGLSAGRSIEKLQEIAWLLSRNDVIEAMNEAGYTNYGAPQLKAFAEKMGFEFKVGQYCEQADLDNMAAGKPCHKGCQEGCDY